MTNSTEELLKAIEVADSADALYEAVKALAAARTDAAIPTLIKVLGYNNPGAAVAAVDGLIDLGEVTVPYLLENLDDYNYGARAWAIRAFAGIGDPQGLHLLLKAASTDFSLSVRRAASRGLGFIRWSKLPTEEILPAQKEVLKTLLFVVCQDGEWVVRYAAVVGLEGLSSALGGSQPNFRQQIVEQFNHMLEAEPELVVRARVQLALQKIKPN